MKIHNLNTRIILVYKRPYLSLLPTDLNAVADSSPNTIIAGDPNVKHHSWNSSNPNPADLVLNNINSRHDIEITAPSTSTHYPNCPSHSPHVLDVALMKIGNLRYTIDNFPTASLDHIPIILEPFSKTTQLSPPTPSHIVHWTLFQTDIEIFYSHHRPGNSPVLIDQAIDELTVVIFANIPKNTSLYLKFNIRKLLPSAIEQ